MQRTHTLKPAACVCVWQGCCRDGPPSRTSWMRWCRSSTRTLRPLLWTLKAERCPCWHGNRLTSLQGKVRSTDAGQRGKGHGSRHALVLMKHVYSVNGLLAFYILLVCLKVTLTCLIYLDISAVNTRPWQELKTCYQTLKIVTVSI